MTGTRTRSHTHTREGSYTSDSCGSTKEREPGGWKLSAAVRECEVSRAVVVPVDIYIRDPRDLCGDSPSFPSPIVASIGEEEKRKESLCRFAEV